MEIWNSYIHEHRKTKHIKIKNNIDKYIKQHDKSYEDIRNSVMETPETKDTYIENILAKIGRKQININV